MADAVGRTEDDLKGICGGSLEDLKKEWGHQGGAIERRSKERQK